MEESISSHSTSAATIVAAVPCMLLKASFLRSSHSTSAATIDERERDHSNLGFKIPIRVHAGSDRLGTNRATSPLFLGGTRRNYLKDSRSMAKAAAWRRRIRHSVKVWRHPVSEAELERARNSLGSFISETWTSACTNRWGGVLTNKLNLDLESNSNFKTIRNTELHQQNWGSTRKSWGSFGVPNWKLSRDLF